MRSAAVFALILFVSVSTGFATVFGTIRGIVHDPQHRPVPGTNVTLKAVNSDYSKTATSDADGQFTFDAVPIGNYSITVSGLGLATAQQTFTLISGASPVFHFELQLAPQTETITVLADTSPAQTESVTPITLVTRNEIDSTP